jgi:hypothetical protein
MALWCPRPPSALWNRAFHSFNLLVILLMAASGLQIHNANPMFGGRGGVTGPSCAS